MSAPVAAGLRRGRVAAWAAVVATFGGIVLFLLVPQTARLIALLTWSEERQDACVVDPECALSVLPGGLLPAWSAVLWPLVIIAALVVCWSPTRWWTPQDAQGRPTSPGVYSTPEYLRLHAVVAVLITGVAAWGLGRGDVTVSDPSYLWATGLAVVGVVLATVSIRVTAGRIPEHTLENIRRGYGWALPGEARRRVRAAEPARVPMSGGRRDARRGTRA